MSPVTTPGEAAFRHLILTRFNIMTEFAPAPQRLEESWLRARLEPFRQYCAPSVSAQTVPVPWLMLVDAASPSWFLDEIAAVPTITPVLLEGPGTPEAISAAVTGTGLVDRPYLITSRVDSDDALARTYAAEVQSAFAFQEWEFIEFPVGIQCLRGGLYTHVWRSNPFLSLVERVQSDRPVSTVFCMSHARVLRTQPTKTVWRRAQWLQTLHAANNESILAGGVVPRLDSRPDAFACRWDPAPADRLPARVGLAWETASQRARRVARREIGRLRHRG